MYNAAIEAASLDELRSLQSKRLRTLVKRVYEDVPFYKKQFDANGIHPSDIKGIEDIHRLLLPKKMI